MISTHVLDQTQGMPASEIAVELQMHRDNEWKSLGKYKTNDDGRIAFDNPSKAGVYRLIFELDEYFQSQGRDNFFVRTPVVFKIEDTNRKYHIPLLLNPYGYSTYRGS